MECEHFIGVATKPHITAMDAIRLGLNYGIETTAFGCALDLLLKITGHVVTITTVIFCKHFFNVCVSASIIKLPEQHEKDKLVHIFYVNVSFILICRE